MFSAFEPALRNILLLLLLWATTFNKILRDICQNKSLVEMVTVY